MIVGLLELVLVVEAVPQIGHHLQIKLLHLLVVIDIATAAVERSIPFQIVPPLYIALRAAWIQLPAPLPILAHRQAQAPHPRQALHPVRQDPRRIRRKRRNQENINNIA